MYWRLFHETFHSVAYPATANIVARQVARAVAESRISSTFRATCLATILAVAGYVAPVKCSETFHSVTAPSGFVETGNYLESSIHRCTQ